MKLKEFLKEAKFAPEPIYTRSSKEIFSNEIIENAIKDTKHTKEYKSILKIGGDITNSVQRKNGTFAFSIPNTNGYYVTINGFLRSYGSESEYFAFGSRNAYQTRLPTIEKIEIIDMSLDQKEIIEKLVSRYIMLFKSLMSSIKNSRKVSNDDKIKLEEGFTGYSVNGSDEASNLWSTLQKDVCVTISKTLKNGLRNPGNEYNTNGLENVAMILCEKAKLLKSFVEDYEEEIKPLVAIVLDKLEKALRTIPESQPDDTIKQLNTYKYWIKTIKREFL